MAQERGEAVKSLKVKFSCKNVNPETREKLFPVKPESTGIKTERDRQLVRRTTDPCRGLAWAGCIVNGELARFGLQVVLSRGPIAATTFPRRAQGRARIRHGRSLRVVVGRKRERSGRASRKQLPERRPGHFPCSARPRPWRFK